MLPRKLKDDSPFILGEKIDTLTVKAHKRDLATSTERLIIKALLAECSTRHAGFAKNVGINPLNSEKNLLPRKTCNFGEEVSCYDKVKEALGVNRYLAYL